MDLILVLCVGFIAGYGVRDVISQRRRREERKKREAHERLVQAKPSV